MIVRWIFVAATLILTSLVPYSEQTCYANEEYPYVFFGTKTVYEFVSHSAKFQPVPKCDPVKLWMLSRHGTRYPGEEEIREMATLTSIRDLIVKNHEIDKEGELCREDVMILKHWNFTLSPNMTYELAEQGQEELRLRAGRMRSSFSSIIQQAYSAQRFTIQSTSKKRAVDSALVFSEALFNSYTPAQVPVPTENDTLLQPEKDCPRWKESSESPEVTKEYRMFREIKHIQEVLHSVSRRLGFRYNLTLDNILLMYDMCRYEKAWNVRSKPAFCAVFIPDEIKVFEYLEDLDQYYQHGYGNELNKRLVCPLVQDLFSKFSNEGLNKSSELSTTLYFAHTSTVFEFLTALNMKRDSRSLTHDGFEIMLNREWKASFIDPFASNIVAVLYKCEDDDDMKVVFYLNEKIVDYPGCNVGLCSWKFLQDQFKSFLDPSTCNLDFCNSTSGALSFLLHPARHFSYLATFFAFGLVLFSSHRLL